MTMLEYLTDNQGLAYLIIILFGLIIGSFYNVAIHRIPLMLFREWHQQCQEFLAENPTPPQLPPRFNLFVPRSHCPGCQQLIPGWHNIPLLSYLILQGRCAKCKTRIPCRYPLVELLSAASMVFMVWHFGFNYQGLAAIIFAGFLIILSFIDFDHQLLPDQLNLLLLWIGLVANCFTLFVDPTSAILGATIGYSGLWLFAHGYSLLTKKEGMGFGDLKLLAALGAWLGWQQLPFIILFASFSGAVVGIILIACKKQTRNKPIPFGPYLALAGLVAMTYGQAITNYYLSQW